MDKGSMDLVKGLGLIAGGILLLLYTLGLIQKGISLIIILAALAIIFYGLMVSGIYEYIMRLVQGRK